MRHRNGSYSAWSEKKSPVVDRAFEQLLSEFPEKVSAFKWAREVNKADMALMNMLSSNVNQWTVLAAMIPLVFSFARGTPSALPFDGAQRLEILLTVMQSLVAVALLINLKFEWWDATLLFVLWLVQFLFADIRAEMCWVYGAWLAGHVVWWLRHPPEAPRVLWGLLRGRSFERVEQT